MLSLKISTREILARCLGDSRHKYNSEGAKRGGQEKKGYILVTYVTFLSSKTAHYNAERAKR